MVLDRGSFTMSYSGADYLRGTYSTSGNNIILTVDQINGAMLDAIGLPLGFLSSEWHTRDQIRTAMIRYLVSGGYTQSQAEDLVDNEAPIDSLFFTISGTYSGDIMTLTVEGAEPNTYTRTR